MRKLHIVLYINFCNTFYIIDYSSIDVAGVIIPDFLFITWLNFPKCINYGTKIRDIIMVVEKYFYWKIGKNLPAAVSETNNTLYNSSTGCNISSTVIEVDVGYLANTAMEPWNNETNPSTPDDGFETVLVAYLNPTFASTLTSSKNFTLAAVFQASNFMAFHQLTYFYDPLGTRPVRKNTFALFLYVFSFFAWGFFHNF